MGICGIMALGIGIAIFATTPKRFKIGIAVMVVGLSLMAYDISNAEVLSTDVVTYEIKDGKWYKNGTLHEKAHLEYKNEHIKLVENGEEKTYRFNDTTHHLGVEGDEIEKIVVTKSHKRKGLTGALIDTLTADIYHKAKPKSTFITIP